MRRVKIQIEIEDVDDVIANMSGLRCSGCHDADDDRKPERFGEARDKDGFILEGDNDFGYLY